MLLVCGLEQLRDLYRAWERRVEAQIWVARHGDAVLAQLLGAQTFADSHVHAGAVGLGVGVDEAAADALCARIAKDDTHFMRRVGKWPSYTWTDAGKEKYAALARVRRGAWGRAPPAGSAPDAPVTPPAPSGDRSPVEALAASPSCPTGIFRSNILTKFYYCFYPCARGSKMQAMVQRW